MRKQTLREIQTADGAEVDREAGVIRGVKVLGYESLNDRTYERAAVKKAIPMYEGIRVNIDHNDKQNPSKDRRVADRFGRLVNIHETKTGLVGDLEYLKSHRLAEQTTEVADRMPEMLGLSHNAEGRTRRDKGRTIVEEITRVRSVDLVSDPATTRSLFESEDMTVTKTIREIIETSKHKVGVAILREMVGEEVMDPEMAVESPEPPAEEEADPDSDAEITMALHTAAKAAIDDTSLDPTATAAKVKEILKAEEKLLGGGKEPSSEPASEPADSEPAAESAAIAKLEKKIDALAESHAKAITDLKGRIGVEIPKGGQTITESANGNFKPATTAEEFRTRIIR